MPKPFTREIKSLEISDDAHFAGVRAPEGAAPDGRLLTAVLPERDCIFLGGRFLVT